MSASHLQRNARRILLAVVMRTFSWPASIICTVRMQRVQISTKALKSYADAVERGFGADADDG
jgi:hypothetical protein